jgi:hypothetical protein
MRAVLAELCACLLDGPETSAERLIWHMINEVSFNQWLSLSSTRGKTPHLQPRTHPFSNHQIIMPPTGLIEVTFPLRRIGCQVTLRHSLFPDVALDAVFMRIGIPLVLEAYHALLLERPVVVHSRNTSLLTAVCETLLSLLYPFEWAYSYVNVLPAELEDYLDAPVTFFLGVSTDVLYETTHAGHASASRSISSVSLRKDICHQVTLIDLDNQECLQPESGEKMGALPKKAELMRTLRTTLYGENIESGWSKPPSAAWMLRGALAGASTSTSGLFPPRDIPVSASAEFLAAGAVTPLPKETPLSDRLRLIFLNYHAHILKSYRSFYRQGGGFHGEDFAESISATWDELTCAKVRFRELALNYFGHCCKQLIILLDFDFCSNMCKRTCSSVLSTNVVRPTPH